MSSGDAFRLRYAAGGRTADAATAARSVAISSAVPSPLWAARAKTRSGRRPSANRLRASYPTTRPVWSSMIGWKNGVNEPASMIDRMLARADSDDPEEAVRPPDRRVGEGLEPHRCEALPDGAVLGTVLPALRPRSAGRALEKVARPGRRDRLALLE